MTHVTIITTTSLNCIKLAKAIRTEKETENIKLNSKR